MFPDFSPIMIPSMNNTNPIPVSAILTPAFLPVPNLSFIILLSLHISIAQPLIASKGNTTPSTINSTLRVSSTIISRRAIETINKDKINHLFTLSPNPVNLCEIAINISTKEITPNPHPKTLSISVVPPKLRRNTPPSKYANARCKHPNSVCFAS